MNINLLASSIIYKDMFQNIPKIYESYENYLKKKIDQVPFKTLIKRYKEKNNSLLFHSEYFLPLMMEEMKNIYNDYYPEFYNTELAFFSGITEWKGFDCFTYYDIKNETLFYIEPDSNEEFLKSFFIQTNENILENITIKNKDWFKDVDLQEYFCINKNKYEKMKSLQNEE